MLGISGSIVQENREKKGKRKCCISVVLNSQRMNKEEYGNRQKQERKKKITKEKKWKSKREFCFTKSANKVRVEHMKFQYYN